MKDVAKELLAAVDAVFEADRRTTWTSSYANQLSAGERAQVYERYRKAREALNAAIEKKETVTCGCVDVDMGSYTATVSVNVPWGDKHAVSIDACLVPEIARLWKLGIRTEESCCGHNKVTGYICVLDEDAEKMTALGYVQIIGTDSCSFVPKSLVPITVQVKP